MSGGHVQYGWQQLYDRYQANYFAPGKSRDSLSFDELACARADTGSAVCDRALQASRAATAVVASGPFTLVLQRQGDRWRILHDHTSPDPK